MDLNLPATGIATADFGVVGADINGAGAWAATSQYFTTPTTATSYGLLTAVMGVLRIGGASIATVTGLSLKVEGGYTTGAVVGSNITPDVFAGRVKVTGQLTAYFDSVTVRDYFINETKFALQCVMWSDTTNTSDFISFALPNCKAMGATKSDGEQGLVMTIPFSALYNGTPTSDVSEDTLRTTMMVCDSKA